MRLHPQLNRQVDGDRREQHRRRLGADDVGQPGHQQEEQRQDGDRRSTLKRRQQPMRQVLGAAGFLQGDAQRQGGGDGGDDFRVHGPERLAHAQHADRHQGGRARQRRDDDRHHPRCRQGDDGKKNHRRPLGMVERRQVLGRPFQQYHVPLPFQRRHVVGLPLDQKHVAGLQPDVGEPLADHPGPALDAEHDAMRFIAEPDLRQGLALHAGRRGDHDLGQGLAAFLPAPARVRIGSQRTALFQVGIQQPRVLGQESGQRLAGRRHHQHVAGPDDVIFERRQDRLFAPLHQAQGLFRQAGEMPPRRAFSDQFGIRRNGDLGDEMPAVALGQAVGQSGPVRQQPGRYKNHIPQPRRRHHQAGDGEVEKRERRDLHLDEGRVDEKVGRRSDERRHAAQNRGVAQRDHQFRHRPAVTVRQGFHDRDEDDDDGDVVEKRADGNGRHQDHQQGHDQPGVAAAQAQDQPGAPVQDSGADHALAHHQKRQHRDQGRIGEALQDAGRGQGRPSVGADDREEMEKYQQHADDAEGRHLHRRALEQVKNQGAEDEGENRPHLKLRPGA